MPRLHGKYVYTRKYNDLNELLAILRSELVSATREFYERLTIYPNNPNFEILVYIKPSTSGDLSSDAAVGILKLNKPYRVEINQLIKILELVPGFIEKYFLDKYGYLNDLESLNYLGRIYGIDKVLYEYNVHELIHIIEEKVHPEKSLSHETRSESPYMLLIDYKISLLLGDVLYRIRYMLGSFEISRIRLRQLISRLEDILSKYTGVLIHTTVGKYDIWIEKKEVDKVGIYISNGNLRRINIRTYREFIDFLKHVVEEEGKKTKYVNIHIYRKYKSK